MQLVNTLLVQKENVSVQLHRVLTALKILLLTRKVRVEHAIPRSFFFFNEISFLNGLIN